MKELIKNTWLNKFPKRKRRAIKRGITEEVRDYVDELRVDALGNLICMKRERVERSCSWMPIWTRLVVVTHIDDKGFFENRYARRRFTVHASGFEDNFLKAVLTEL